jgi:hypothetical protein
MRLHAPLLAACLALLVLSGRLPAQRISLSSEIGFYIPTEKLVDAANGTVGELEAGPSFGLLQCAPSDVPCVVIAALPDPTWRASPEYTGIRRNREFRGTILSRRATDFCAGSLPGVDAC